MTSQFADMTSPSIFFDAVLFLLSSLATGPSFMSISSLVLESWQFSFIRDYWPEIKKSDTKFCTMFLKKCYWMLQNAKVTAFNVSEFLRENQQRGNITQPLTQIRIKKSRKMFFISNKKLSSFSRYSNFYVSLPVGHCRRRSWLKINFNVMTS